MQQILRTEQMQQHLRKQVLLLLANNLEDLDDVGTKAGYDFVKGIQRGIELLYAELLPQ